MTALPLFARWLIRSERHQNAFWQVFFSIHITKANLNKPLSSPIRAARATAFLLAKQVSNPQWNTACKLPHPIFQTILIVTERHKITYRNICTSAEESTSHISRLRGNRWKKTSSKNHIPSHKNYEWITAQPVCAEKTYVSVYACSLIGKSHIDHQAEATLGLPPLQCVKNG